MAYTPKTWSTNDTVTAADLNDLETGLGATSTKADGAVQNTGAETVAGVKTFSSSPIVPTPTTSGQATTKGYVDGLQGGLTNAAPGLAVIVYWSGTGWRTIGSGTDLTARPGGRSDLPVIAVGAPAATADATWMIAGTDLRLDS